MDVETVGFLRSAEAQTLIESVGVVEDDDLLPVLQRLRRSLTPSRASAVVETARLRARARVKFTDPSHMLFTVAGLEQASGHEVARHRAAGFTGQERVADLGCGVGGDALAFAEITEVLAIDDDPVTVTIARHNLDGRAWVARGDATRPPVAPGEWSVFLDPSRRGGSGRVFDPEGWSPRLDVAVGLARRARLGAVKTAPGLPHDLIPPDAAADWVSVARELKECVLWFGDGRDPRVRTAVGADVSARFSAVPDRDGPIAAVGSWIHEPDPAIIRSGLVANLARAFDLARIDPRIAYLTGDRVVDHPFVRSYAVESVHAFNLKALKAHLRELDIGSVTIKKRGSPLTPEQLRRQLDLEGSGHRVLLVTRIGDAPTVVVAVGEGQATGRVQT